MVTTSLISRVMRSTELGSHGIQYDEEAKRFLVQAAGSPLRIIANRPDTGLEAEYAAKLKEAREAHHLPPDAKVVFLEIYPGDASEFSGALQVKGRRCRRPRDPVDAQSGDSQRHCGDPARPPRPDRGDAARLFRVDGRQSRSPTCCGSWHLARAIPRRSRARCFARPSRAQSFGPGSTSGRGPKPRPRSVRRSGHWSVEPRSWRLTSDCASLELV